MERVQQRATMPMAGYLAEVQQAVEGLLPLIWQEQDTFSRLEAQAARLERAAADDYTHAEPIAAIARDIRLAGALRWDAYRGRHGIAERLPALRAAVRAHRLSVDALAGALIQIAKQGIALAHGGRIPAAGRWIGRSQQLGNVIWQARNQALHWEDQDFGQPVDDCFTALASEVNPVFNDYLTRSMALDVIEMLGWRAIAAFEKDLTSVG